MRQLVLLEHPQQTVSLAYARLSDDLAPERARASEWDGMTGLGIIWKG